MTQRNYHTNSNLKDFTDTGGSANIIHAYLTHMAAHTYVTDRIFNSKWY